MKYLLVLTTAVCLTLSSYGQESFNPDSELKKMVSTPNTPESQAFGAYGDIPVNLRSGEPNISVPLYTYKGLEFDLPISLSYDMNARKVAEIANAMGMGWNLNLGGRITLNTNGLSDQFDSIISSPSGYNSLLSSSTLRTDLLKYKDKQVNDNCTPGAANTFVDQTEAEVYFDFLDKLQHNHFDVTMDTYSLNVMGISDRIIMDLVDNGSSIVVEPKTLHNPRLVANYSTSSNGNSLLITSWEITDDKGNTYTFGQIGGNGEGIEKTYTYNGLDITGSPWGIGIGPLQMTYNSSWALTKIVSANQKDTYEFEYQEFDFWNDPIATMVSRTVDVGPTQLNGPWSVTEKLVGSTYEYTSQILTSVKHNNKVVIDIDLGPRDDFFNDSKIESITIKSPLDGSTMNHFKFTHSLFGDVTPGFKPEDVRLKLDKIKIAGKGFDGSPTYDFEKEYSFVYHNPDGMPARTCLAQDEFGFFNNGSCNQDFYPAPSSANQSTYPSPGGGDRSFDEDNAKIGILTEVHYPTGGHTKFDYETHLNTGDSPNGFRVKEISSYTDANTIATIKQYEYFDQLADNNLAPIMEYAVPKMYVENLNITQGGDYHRISKPALSDQPYITYGKVIERIIEPISGLSQHGKTQYQFYNLDQFQDPMGVAIDGEAPFSTHYYGNQSKGQIFKEIIYDASDTVLSESTHVYDDNDYLEDISYYGFAIKDAPERGMDYVQITPTGNGTEVKACYLEGIPTATGVERPNTDCLNNERYARIQPVLITYRSQQRLQEDHFSTQTLNGNNITTSNSSKYVATDINYLLDETITSTSESNKTLVTKYEYPQDLDNLGDTAIDGLVTANRLASPLEVRTYERVTGNNDVLLSTQITKYQSLTKNFQTRIVPEKIQASRRSDTPEDRVNFLDYDDDFNPVEMAKESGTSSCYIWAYEGRLPVAKIENAVYGNIDPNLISNIKNASLGQGPVPDLFTALNNLRIDPTMSEAMVTSYIYNDQMQLESMTDPRGYTTYYYYDDENRLEYVTDADGKVLSSSAYNYNNN